MATPVTPAPLKPEEIRREFTLPSGKKVTIRRGKGRDLRLALLAAGPKADPYRIVFALVAQLALIDGKRVTMEAIDDFDLDDAQELLAEGGQTLGPLGKIKSLETEAEDGKEQPGDQAEEKPTLQ